MENRGSCPEVFILQRYQESLRFCYISILTNIHLTKNGEHETMDVGFFRYRKEWEVT